MSTAVNFFLILDNSASRKVAFFEGKNVRIFRAKSLAHHIGIFLARHSCFEIVKILHSALIGGELVVNSQLLCSEGLCCSCPVTFRKYTIFATSVICFFDCYLSAF